MENIWNTESRHRVNIYNTQSLLINENKLPKHPNRDIIKSMNKQFKEEKIQMGIADMKRFSDSLVIQKWELKLTPRCHFITQTDGN